MPATGGRYSSTLVRQDLLSIGEAHLPMANVQCPDSEICELPYVSGNGTNIKTKQKGGPNENVDII